MHLNPLAKARPPSLLVIAMALIGSAGCSPTEPEIDNEAVVELVDNFCWALRTSDGLLEPTTPSFPTELKVEGIRVRFSGTIREDISSPCQIGPIIELEKMERIQG